MNRRDFLTLLVPAVAATAVVPELVSQIWTPKRTFFLPPAGGWASAGPWTVNTLGGYCYSRSLADDYYFLAWPVTPRKFTREDAIRFTDQLAFNHFKSTIKVGRDALDIR